MQILLEFVYAGFYWNFFVTYYTIGKLTTVNLCTQAAAVHMTRFSCWCQLVTSCIPRNAETFRVPAQIAFSNSLFSLSDSNFSLCQFTWLVTISYTKLTCQTLKRMAIFGANIDTSLTFSQGIYNLSKPNSLFWQNFLFSLTGNFLGHFPCAVGTLDITSCYKSSSWLLQSRTNVI